MRSKINISRGKTVLFALLLSLLSLSSLPVMAYEPEEKKPEMTEAQEGGKDTVEKFNAGEMIMDHIGDSHQWHMWGDHGHATHIPLPVILWTDKGLEMFSSSHVEHEEDIYTGKHYKYMLKHEHIEIVDDFGMVNEEATAKIIDFSITKNAATIIVSSLFLILIFFSVAKAYNRRPGQAPKGLQSFMEPLIIFIRDDVAKTSIGEKKYMKYMPYLLTAFFFIFLNNLLGLIPLPIPGFGANLTGNISVCLVLSGITLLITLISANGHYWRHIFAMPGVPIPVLIILTPIELIGVVLRPFVLMIRLFANITAGHIIALAFFSLIFIFGKGGEAPGAGYGISVVSILFTVFMGFLELLVAFLQAYVFTLLSAIYIGAAVEEGHHENDHHAPEGHQTTHVIV
jgi:F-type H+-transporting ATPase subunit a